MHYITLFNHGKFEFFALSIALIPWKSRESLYILEQRVILKIKTKIQ